MWYENQASKQETFKVAEQETPLQFLEEKLD